MLDIELRLRNYRCFGDEPARVRITDGFTALVGTNNSGKSSLLRSLYELRPLFRILSNNNNPGQALRLGGAQPNGTWNPSIPLGERVFRTGTQRPIDVELTIFDSP